MPRLSACLPVTYLPGALPAPPTGRYFPKVGYLSFDAAQLDKIVAKVREFAQDASTTPALSEQDLALLQSLATTLSQTNRYHATEVRPRISEDEEAAVAGRG